MAKDRTQAADWSGTVSPYDTAVYPGYAADLAALAGCLDVSGDTPADVRSLLLGDGTSPVTGASATGMTLSYDL